MAYVNINGRIVEAVQPIAAARNSGLRYGYGLFETMLVRNGQVALLEYHKERLHAGMQQLHLKAPALQRAGAMEEEIGRVVRKNGLGALCRVRLQVYGGDGGLFEPTVTKANFVIECFAIEESVTQMNENGLVVGIAEGLQKSTDSLANLKTCNVLIYAMAAQQAKSNKWNDALICNTLGNIAESTIANIFWIKGDVIYTPPLTEGCVAGVMRRHLMSKHVVRELPLSIGILLDADEVLLTNAIRGIKWVGIIGERRYTNTISRTLLP